MTRHVAADQYGAQGLKADLLHSIMSMTGAINASDCLAIPARPTGYPVAVTVDEIHQLTSHMLATEMGERFSLGDYDMLSLRFVVEDDGMRAVTMLAVEDYPSPHPVLVNGHVTDRAEAIMAWLGDADADEHPDLYLVIAT